MDAPNCPVPLASSAGMTFSSVDTTSQGPSGQDGTRRTFVERSAPLGWGGLRRRPWNKAREKVGLVGCQVRERGESLKAKTGLAIRLRGCPRGFEDCRDQALEGAQRRRLVLELGNGQVCARKTNAANPIVGGRRRSRRHYEIQNERICHIVRRRRSADACHRDGRHLLPRHVSGGAPPILKCEAAGINSHGAHRDWCQDPTRGRRRGLDRRVLRGRNFKRRQLRRGW